MRRLLLCTSIMALMMTVITCGGSKGAPPTFEPLPEPTTPPEFVTFTDESSLFSIAYPPEWELALSLMPELEEITKDILSSKQSGLLLDRVGIVFFAGLPTEEGFDPGVQIFVESLPAEISIDEYYEASLRLARELFTGYKVHSQTSVLIGEER